MNTQFDVEPVTVNDVLGLASWERERKSAELQQFIASKALDFSEIYDALA